MVKKIGKFIAIYLIAFPAYAGQTTLSLAITDHNGRPMQQAQVGIPFFIEAVIGGDEINVGTPNIEGLKAFHIQDQGMVSTMRTTVNGVTTNKKTHRYLVRADKEGRFAIGPAQVKTQAGTLTSGIVYVTVGAQQVTTNTDEAIVRLLMDKTKVVVGEKVGFSIRFYYQNGVSLTGISDPQLKDISLQGPYTGVELVDGVRMNYLEWRSDFYPSAAGKISIPPVRATYRMQRMNRSAGFDIFSLFDNAFDQKYIYSNGLSIDVDSLPHTNESVSAVGVFDSIELMLDKNEAAEGDGIVLRLTVNGSGNTEKMLSPKLVLPQGLTSYDSQTSLRDFGGGKTATIFEYIVQGIKPGSYTIPEQMFTYFNTQDRSYKTLKTSTAHLTITPGTGFTPDQKDSSPTIESAAGDVSTSQSAHEQIPLLPHGAIHSPSHWQLPWSFFWAGIFGFFCALLARYVQPFILQRRLSRSTKKEYAFANARSRLARLKKAGRSKRALYDLFMQFFAQRAQCPVNEMTEDLINEQLKQAGCSNQMIDQWEIFFKKCAAFAFFSGDAARDNEQTLYQEAEQWLSRLQEYL
ncbi:MAG TPA: BatD family protein [Candidatus Babeliales bacterium]|nr:BatD family protein [Candidatus Babeliales bacterium]